MENRIQIEELSKKLNGLINLFYNISQAQTPTTNILLEQIGILNTLTESIIPGNSSIFELLITSSLVATNILNSSLSYNDYESLFNLFDKYFGYNLIYEQLTYDAMVRQMIANLVFKSVVDILPSQSFEFTGNYYSTLTSLVINNDFNINETTLVLNNTNFGDLVFNNVFIDQYTKFSITKFNTDLITPLTSTFASNRLLFQFEKVLLINLT
jgi:hypothetical protein